MSEIDRYETLFGPMFHYADDEVIGRSLRQYGQWAIDEIALIAHIMRSEPAGDFIDLGANVGTHTIGIASLFPMVEVFAFEANPRTHQLLSTNATANGLTNANLLNYLIGDVSGISRVVTNMADIGKNLGAVGFQVVPVDTRAGQLLLQVSVDDIYPADRTAAFVKIDVEGMELKALRGARATLARSRPAIYFENGVRADAGPLFDDLATLGYETFWHINFPFDEQNFRGDKVNVFGGSVEIGTLCVHQGSMMAEEMRACLTETSRPIDEHAWYQCVALNARLREALRANFHRNDRAAWLRSELLQRRPGEPDCPTASPPDATAATELAPAASSGDRPMPSFAEIRRATLLDIPGDVLRPLLLPYIAAAPLDEEAYLQRYPDVAEAVATQRIGSAREHYVIAGYFEGRRS
jgi:FkbM family methyltransferase